MRRAMLFVLAAALALGFAMLHRAGSAPAGLAHATCPDLTRGCAIGTPGHPVRVRFSHRPSALAPVDLEVVAPSVRQAQAQFSMVGMDMGPNRYRLLPIGPGRFVGHILLPACVAGRSDWILTLDLDGRRTAIPFSATP